MGSLPSNSKPSKSIFMKKMTATLCLTVLICLAIAVFWNGAEDVACEGSPTSDPHTVSSWTNCFGIFLGEEKYVGDYRNGKKNGPFTVIYADGSKYLGKYRNDRVYGQGTYTFADGRVKEGIWKNGEFQDAQKVTPTVTARKSPPSSKNAAEQENERLRREEVRGSDLPPCRGSYHNCFGTRDYTNGRYVGEYRNDKVHGQGTLTFADGDKYVGEWRDNKFHGQGTYTFFNGRVEEGIWKNNEFQYAQKISPTVTARKSPPPSKSAAEKEIERLRKENARLKKEKQSQPKQVAKRPPPKKSPPPSSGSTGSGFFVSKLGHIVTNEHVVRQCGSVTVGDNANKQVTASVLETDKRNDLALLRISSTKMASAETKSLIRKLNVQKLGLKLVPLASEGLFKSEDVELGEDVLVAGYPYGELYSNTIKVTKGIVSANKGMGDDRGQFQMDAAVQPGNSGGPIYDENGNIVGVVISQLNKLKVAKAIGSLPENVNFGTKASTVRQFLTSAGLPTKWSNRTTLKQKTELAQIAKNQTVMVVCNP